MQVELPEIRYCKVVVFETIWSLAYHPTLRHEILHILNGEMRLDYPDGRKFRAVRGDTLVIPDGQLHKDVFSPRKDLRILFMEFDWKNDGGLVAALDNAKITRLSVEVRAELRELFERQRQETSPELARARLYTILLILQRAMAAVPEPAGKEQENRIVAGAKRYIAMNFTRSFNLNDVAAFLKVSPSYLSRLFSRCEELSLSEYIQDVRLTEAKHLLRDSNLNVNEVAARTGFASVNYFTRLFRQKTGVSPRKYR